MANQYTPFRFMSDTHKECSLCNKIKEHSEFHKDKRNKRCKGLCYYCKECANQKGRDYVRDKPKINLQIASKKFKRKQKAIEMFGNKCHDCLKTYPSCCYDFHHLDPKQKDLNPANAVSYSEETYMNEIKKCIMLCSNCHRIRHSS